MKYRRKFFLSWKNLILLIGAVLFAPFSNVQAQDFRVIDADLKSQVSDSGGKCPVTITFTGYITVNAPGKVKYTFLRSDGAGTRISEIYFKEAGTQPVSTQWRLGSNYSTDQISGWQTLKILAPNEMVTSREASSFTINCMEAEKPAKEKLAENEVEVLCPLDRIRTEIVTPFSAPWWQTPIQAQLTNVKMETVGGATALICDYAGYGLARRLPGGTTDCRTNNQKNGFVCW